MTEMIKTALDDHGVLRVTIDRPEKKNALTQAMYEELVTAFRRGDEAPGVRAILLEGHPEIFTAGNDLGDFLAGGSLDGDPPVLRWIKQCAVTDTPLIGAVSGAAIGVGATILLHFDLVYADETARFHMPFVDLATVPEAGASYLLPHRFGRQVAAEIMLLSEPITADRAFEMNILNGVIRGGDVRAHALDVARKIAAKPPTAMALSKQLIRGNVDDLLAHIDLEAHHFAERLQSDEMRAVIMKKMMAKGK